MLDFQYCNATRFIFGRGHEDRVGEYIKEYGAKKVLVMHYGTGLDFENKLNERILRSLKAAGLDYVDFTGIERSEITIGDRAVQIVKEEGIDFLLPVGGGAVIDVAKYVAVAARYDGDTWEDFYVNHKKPLPDPIMLGAVSTVAASGSENSPDSVIGKGTLKRTMSDLKIRPLFAIIDPELLYTLPPKITAAGAADIMAHAHERYFSPTPDNYFTDELNEAAIRTIIRYAPVAMAEPDNYNARAQMLWAGLLAHNGMFEVGRETDRAVHCIESEIGGMYHSIHGIGCGAVTMAWAKYMCKRDIPKFTTYFHRVWGVEMDMLSPENMLREGIRRMVSFYTALGIPENFAELGVREEDVPTLVSTTRVTPEGLVGGYSRLTKEDLTHIYMIGLGKETVEI